MYKKNIRVLGASWNILPFTNKDRNKILLNDSFNTEVRNALSSGLSMFNDFKKDAWLYTNLDPNTKTNLEKSDFNFAAQIIDKNVKPVSAWTAAIEVVSNRVEKDTKSLIDDIWNYGNKIKSYFNDVLNIPITVSIIILLIVLLKK